MPLLRFISILLALLIHGNVCLLLAQPERKIAASEPLPPGASLRMGTSRLRHLQAIREIRFTPDGRHLATIGQDEVYSLWSLQTGSEVRRVLLADKAKLDPLRTEQQEIEILMMERAYGTLSAQTPTGRLSVDGKVLIRSTPGRVDLLDAVTGAESARVVFPDKRVGLVSLSADGKRLARFLQLSQEAPPQLDLIDVASGKSIQKLRLSQNDYLLHLVFSNDGKYLAGSSNDCQISLWDLTTGKRARRYEMAEAVTALAFPPLSNGLMSANGKSAAFWDLASEEEAVKLPLKEVSHCAAVLSPDGKTLATSGPDKMILLWDIATGVQKSQLVGNLANVSALAFSADGKQLASGTFEGTAHTWDVETLQEITPVRHGPKLQLLAHLDARTLLVKSGHDSELQQIEIGSGKVLKTLFGPPAGQTPFAAIAPNGKLSAHPNQENPTIQLWDTEKNREMQRLEGHGYQVGQISFSPNGRWLASLDYAKSLRIWNVETGKQVHSVETPFSVDQPQLIQFRGRIVAFRGHQQTQQLSTPHLVFSHDNRYLLALGQMNSATLLDLTTGKERARFALGKVPVSHLVASPDSRHFATVSSGEVLRIWNTLDGSMLYGFVNTLGDIRTLAFSASGKQLAVGTSSGAVIIYDLAQGKEKRRFLGHRAAVTKVLFAGSDRLLSASDDATLLFWDLNAPMPSVSRTEQLSDARLAELWAQLALAESETAHQACREMVANPRATLKYLGEHLKPIPAANPTRLRQLVADLESGQFTVREKATQELIRLDAQVLPILRKTLNENPSAELSRRARVIADKLEDLKIAPEPLRAIRAVEVLERIGSADAFALLKSLAAGASEARLTVAAQEALERRAILAAEN